MNARTLAIGMVTFIYTLVVVAAYWVVTGHLNSKLPLLLERKVLFDEIDALKNVNMGIGNKIEIAKLSVEANELRLQI